MLFHTYTFNPARNPVVPRTGRTGPRFTEKADKLKFVGQRLSHPPKPILFFVFSKCPKSLLDLQCSGVVTAPSKTHPPCLLSERAQNCFCLLSLVGFYVAGGPLVPIKVSSSMKWPVLVLHSACLQLNHAVGLPPSHPDCLCFMRPDHNGTLLSLWWAVLRP